MCPPGGRPACVLDESNCALKGLRLKALTPRCVYNQETEKKCAAGFRTTVISWLKVCWRRAETPCNASRTEGELEAAERAPGPRARGSGRLLRTLWNSSSTFPDQEPEVRTLRRPLSRVPREARWASPCRGRPCSCCADTTIDSFTFSPLHDLTRASVVS